jgi:hypothetical protein
MKSTSTATMAVPEGMTLGDLRSFVNRCDGAADEAVVTVRLKWGSRVKEITIEQTKETS